MVVCGLKCTFPLHWIFPSISPLQQSTIHLYCGTHFIHFLLFGLRWDEFPHLNHMKYVAGWTGAFFFYHMPDRIFQHPWHYLPVLENNASSYLSFASSSPSPIIGIVGPERIANLQVFEKLKIGAIWWHAKDPKVTISNQWEDVYHAF